MKLVSISINVLKPKTGDTENFDSRTINCGTLNRIFLKMMIQQSEHYCNMLTDLSWSELDDMDLNDLWFQQEELHVTKVVVSLKIVTSRSRLKLAI